GMPEVTVSEVKSFLRVIHSADDAMIQILIDSAEQEACNFMNRTMLATLPIEYESDSESEDTPSSEDPIAADVRVAVYLLVQAKYEKPDPDEAMKMRHAAETLLWPYRRLLGV